MTVLSYWPVFISSVSDWENTSKSNYVLELLGIFLIFCCVLYLAYIASRFVGKKFSAAGQSKYMKIIDRLSLGLDRNLILVKVGSDYYLFIAGRKEFKMVAKVKIDNTGEAGDDNETVSGPVFDFREIFDKYINRDPKKQRRKNETEAEDRDEKLKESITRLKKMQEKTDDKEV